VPDQHGKVIGCEDTVVIEITELSGGGMNECGEQEKSRRQCREEGREGCPEPAFCDG
jgi:hypothetical protein